MGSPEHTPTYVKKFHLRSINSSEVLLGDVPPEVSVVKNNDYNIRSSSLANRRRVEISPGSPGDDDNTPLLPTEKRTTLQALDIPNNEANIPEDYNRKQVKTVWESQTTMNTPTEVVSSNNINFRNPFKNDLVENPGDIKIRKTSSAINLRTVEGISPDDKTHHLNPKRFMSNFSFRKIGGNRSLRNPPEKDLVENPGDIKIRKTSSANNLRAESSSLVENPGDIKIRKTSSVHDLRAVEGSSQGDNTLLLNKKKSIPFLQTLLSPKKNNSEANIPKDCLQQVKTVWELENLRDNEIYKKKEELQAAMDKEIEKLQVKMDRQIDNVTRDLNNKIQKRLSHSPNQLLWHNLISSSYDKKLAKVTAETLTKVLEGKSQDSVLFKKYLREFYIPVSEYYDDNSFAAMKRSVFSGVNAISNSFESIEDRKVFSEIFKDALDLWSEEERKKKNKEYFSSHVLTELVSRLRGNDKSESPDKNNNIRANTWGNDKSKSPDKNDNIRSNTWT
jgi:hypothetical protein